MSPLYIICVVIATCLSSVAAAIIPLFAGKCAAIVSAYPPHPRSGCCGIDSRFQYRISGGVPTEINQYPWLAYIEYVFANGTIETKTRCAGSLISGKYVLTAAHCVVGVHNKYGKPKNIRLGEYDTSNKGADCWTKGRIRVCTDGVTVIPIEKIIGHPSYDIALIRMKQMAPWTDFIRPLCLPIVDIMQAPPPNLRLIVTGWGLTENRTMSIVKRHVNLPHKKCPRSYISSGPDTELWNNQLCFGGEPGKDSCRGDSGGPLMNQYGRTYEAIGVISRGPDPCGQPGKPGVYVKVYSFMNWILGQIHA